MASIILSPPQGPTGTQITLTGIGFSPLSPLTLTWGEPATDSVGTPLFATPLTLAFSVAASNSGGSVTGTFIAPNEPTYFLGTPGITYTVTLTDGDANSATATFTLCALADGDGIDLGPDGPILAYGGRAQTLTIAGVPTEVIGGRVVAYAHHDGNHYVAWTDPSTGGTFGLGQTIGGTFPPDPNHALNVTVVSDDGSFTINHELDLNYCFKFHGANVPGFQCQCAPDELGRTDPAWQERFQFQEWSKPVYDAKFASDGTTLWLSILTRETVPYPYITGNDGFGCLTGSLNDCTSPSQISQFQTLEELTDNFTSFATGNTWYDRNYHRSAGIPDSFWYQVITPTSDSGEAGSGHWSPPVVVVFAGGIGGFSRIGEVDAKFCPGITEGLDWANSGTGGPLFAQVSPRGSFFSGVSLAASETEPGVCHLVWSEGGDGTGPAQATGAGAGGGGVFVPGPELTYGANLISNGNFVDDTDWLVFSGDISGALRPPGEVQIGSGQARLFAAKDDSTWPFSELSGTTSPYHSDHEYGLLYTGNEWIPPAGISYWRLLFTYQRRQFSSTMIDDGLTNNPPWGIGTGTPKFPGDFDLGEPYPPQSSGGYGGHSVYANMFPRTGFEGGIISGSFTNLTLAAAGFLPIGTAQAVQLDFAIQNNGPGTNPWSFAFIGAQQMIDHDWDFVTDYYDYYGFAFGISHVSLQQGTPLVPPTDDGSGGGGSGSGAGTGYGWDNGPANRGYRVAYATFDAAGQTGESDLFSSVIDRSTFHFPYGGYSFGFSWPEQKDAKFSGQHVVRNDHGSPVLFIAWPKVVTNPDDVPPDENGNPWPDRGLDLATSIEMYDIAGGSPALLQTLDSSFIPTEAETANYYANLGYTAPFAPTAISGGIRGYGNGIDGLVGPREGGIVIDRGFAVSRLYDDPRYLDATSQPVYLVSVPWFSPTAGTIMRGFYRVPVDGSAAFDWMDGVRQLDFTVISSSEFIGDQTGVVAGGLFGGEGLTFSGDDFYSDPNNVWVPSGQGGRQLSGLYFDRICLNQWSPYTIPDDAQLGALITLLGATPGSSIHEWNGGVGVNGNYYDAAANKIAYVGLPGDQFQAALFSIISLDVCRACVPCKCAPVGLHVWHVN